ncbi:recombinase family protein [Candidatus Acetothermia bacterium]|nr:recombinase family protein [Candidatus Acetothermia bacterium]
MGRSVRDLANIVEELRHHDKQLVSVHDTIDTSTPNGDVPPGNWTANKVNFYLMKLCKEEQR